MGLLKKHIGTILVFAVITGIATCNYRLNTSFQKEKIENPEPGDYYVFQHFPEKNAEAIMKIKEVTGTEIIFYIPHGGIIGGFESNKSENAVRKADEQGRMYGKETITVTKEELEMMVDNNTLTGAMDAKPRMEHAF